MRSPGVFVVQALACPNGGRSHAARPQQAKAWTTNGKIDPRSKSRSSALVAIFALALLSNSFAQIQNSPIAYTSGILIGTVTDSKGDPLSGARITLNRTQGAQIDPNDFKKGHNAV